jgi:hypothetical protein
VAGVLRGLFGHISLRIGSLLSVEFVASLSDGEVYFAAPGWAIWGVSWVDRTVALWEQGIGV